MILSKFFLFLFRVTIFFTLIVLISHSPSLKFWSYPYINTMVVPSLLLPTRESSQPFAECGVECGGKALGTATAFVQDCCLEH